MRKLIGLTMMGALAMGLTVGLSGCSEEAGNTVKQTTTNPDGSKTTVTESTKVEKSGSNAPAPGHPATP